MIPDVRPPTIDPASAESAEIYATSINRLSKRFGCLVWRRQMHLGVNVTGGATHRGANSRTHFGTSYVRRAVSWRACQRCDRLIGKSRRQAAALRQADVVGRPIPGAAAGCGGGDLAIVPITLGGTCCRPMAVRGPTRAAPSRCNPGSDACASRSAARSPRQPPPRCPAPRPLHSIRPSPSAPNRGAPIPLSASGR